MNNLIDIIFTWSILIIGFVVVIYVVRIVIIMIIHAIEDTKYAFRETGKVEEKSNVNFRDYQNYLYPENWDDIRGEVLKRDGYRCGNCGSSENIIVHHIVPLAKGGTNSVNNLRTLCDDCHKKIHPHLI